jgi:preprotein translocase subunit SecG
MLVTLLLILFVISAILLIGIVLLQDEQGDGMGGIFGGGSGTAFGSRSGNILTRITSILAIIFLGSAFVIGFINSTSVDDKQEQLAKTRELLDEDREDWLYNTEEDKEQVDIDQPVQNEDTENTIESNTENTDQ